MRNNDTPDKILELAKKFVSEETHKKCSDFELLYQELVREKWMIAMSYTADEKRFSALVHLNAKTEKLLKIYVQGPMGLAGSAAGRKKSGFQAYRRNLFYYLWSDC
ncbi:MAG: hypothetical protein AB1485_01670 [Candidatus Thermoplasmatota archaeon]